MSVPRVEVLVVGGGVIGVAIADELARRGIGTLLLERHDLAAGASGGAAGLIGAPIEGPAAGPFFELALAAQELLRTELPQLSRETRIDVGYRETGTVRVAEDEAEAAELRARIAERRERGLDVRWLDRSELEAMEPGFPAALSGALLVADHHQVTSPGLVRALASRALRRGAVIRERHPVRRLLRAEAHVVGAHTDDGEIRARVVVLAAGPWTAELAPIPLSLRPVKGQLAYLRPEHPIVRRPVFTRDVYIVPKPDGRLVVGATEEDVGFDRTPRDEVSRALVARAAEVLPAVRGLALAGSWAGLRPAAPDRLPIIGSSRDAPGLILATGHFRNGVFLSLITARIVGALVAGERSPAQIAAFSPERFVPERTA